MNLFPDTKWTILAEATLNGDDSGRDALGEICHKYKDPVDRVIQSKGVYAERVEDVRQDFFLSLMKGSFFKKANPTHGKFRSFLLNALRQFLVDDYRKLMTQKRGGELEHVEVEDDIAISETDDTEFDLVWAETLFDSAMLAVGSEV